MADIGVRELKARASEIVRDVRDRLARYVITYRGRPVAVLIPLGWAGIAATAVETELAADAWEDLTRLGEAIGRTWQSPRTSAELLSDMRR